MPIIVECLHADTQMPRRATEGSAGYDLFAYVRGQRFACSNGLATWDVELSPEQGVFNLDPGTAALIPLGFKAQLPVGIEAQIRPRSGTAFKKGLDIPNAPGTVDSDFPDEWRVVVRNPLTHPISIEHGDRIAQMVLARYEVLQLEPGAVGVSTDRTGGFGSTGR
jgi:dUTP pyrophosphatase